MNGVNNNNDNSVEPTRDRNYTYTNMGPLQIVAFLIELIVRYFIVLFKKIAYLFISPPSKDISNQVALVTGSGNGLGREIAISLAKEGCHIAVVDIDMKGAEETVLMVKKFNVNAKAYKVDVSSFADVESLGAIVENDLGPVDILVNNAAILELKLTSEETPEEIEQMIKVNILQYFWTMRVFLDGMITRKRGHIVGISSLGGHLAIPDALGYSSSKSAVNGFMESLRVTLGSKNQDYVKTTTVSPYFISTRKDLVDRLKKLNLHNKHQIFTPTFAADRIVKGIRSDERKIFLPDSAKIAILLWFLTPNDIKDFVMKTFTKMTTRSRRAIKK